MVEFQILFRKVVQRHM